MKIFPVLSIKMTLVTLLLLGGALVYTANEHKEDLERAFSRELENRFKAQTELFHALVHEEQLRHIGYGDVFLQSASSRIALENGSDAAIQRMMEDLWNAIGTESDVKQLGFYAPDGRAVWVEGNGVDARRLIQERAITLFSAEEPIRGIECSDSCHEYVAFMGVAQYGPPGAVFMASTFDQVLRSLHLRANLVTSMIARLPPVGGSISSHIRPGDITNSEIGRDLVEQLDRAHTDWIYEAINSPTGFLHQTNSQYISVQATRLDTDSDHVLVLANDVTRLYQGLQDSYISSLLRSTALLVGALLAIGFVSWFYTTRLMKVTRSMPFLASGQHIKAQTLLKNIRGSFWPDEVDDLKASAIQASQELDMQLKKRAEAEKRDRQKSVFLAKTNHDIRSLLTPIISLSDLVVTKETLSEAKVAVRQIHELTTMLADLTEESIDLSKIEADTLDINESDDEIVRLLARIFHVVQHNATDKGLGLYLDIDASVPQCIRTDHGKLRRIVLNLVSNAVKYTQSGHVRVHVSMSEDAIITVLNIAVSDTGPGIAEDDQEKVFSMYHRTLQANSGTTGHGVGLYIARTMARHLGGDILLQSKLGQGSEFKLSVPIHPVRTCHPVEATLYAPALIAVPKDCAVEDVAIKRVLGHYQRVTPDEIASVDTSFNLIVLYSGDTPDATHMAAAFERLRNSGVLLCIGSSPMQPVAGRPTGSLMISTPAPLKAADLQAWSSTLAVWLDLQTLRGIPTDTSRGSPVRMLVADDQYDIRYSVVEALTPFGYEVDQAKDGNEALDMLLSGDYEVALIDMQMPGRFGSDVIDAAKKSGLNTRCILFTADATSQSQSLARAVGADSFLSKPYRRESLLATLDRLAGVDRISNALQADYDLDLESPDTGINTVIKMDVFNQASERVIQVFLEDGQRLVNDLYAAAADNDVILMRKILHRLKGSSHQFGAVGLAKVLDELHDDIHRTGRIPPSLDNIKAVEQSFFLTSSMMLELLERRNDKH